MKKANKLKVRIPGELFARMQEDLRRPHEFASERVGFAYADTVRLKDGTILALFKEYRPVKDEHYLHAPRVGAKIGSSAIREAMQHVMDYGRGGFHVHLHDHYGPTGPSGTDESSLPQIVESLTHADRRLVHGLMILSRDAVFVQGQMSESPLTKPLSTIVIRSPLIADFPATAVSRPDPVFHRQSFLGAGAERKLANIHVGLIGLGGGGSHLVQQLAYLGVRHFTLFDFDHLTVTNHNRLIGGYFKDIRLETPKVKIAARMIRNICPKAVIRIVQGTWEDEAQALQACDIAFGAVDTYQSRSQLEAACRRYLIPYIDIGMDVHAHA
ncbi:MAG: ThiF family adenylyltransferase, partial [Bacteroidetes bacterium]|nr:ThiF family adenylyltransferase [Bacteroidota bacterium]